MPDYSDTVVKLRDVYRAYVVTGNEKAGQFLADAALAIETLTKQVENLRRELRRTGAWQSTQN